MQQPGQAAHHKLSFCSSSWRTLQAIWEYLNLTVQQYDRMESFPNAHGHAAQTRHTMGFPLFWEARLAGTPVAPQNLKVWQPTPLM